MGRTYGFHVYIIFYIFREDGLKQAAGTEKYFSEFFQNVKVWFRENDLKKELKFNENDNVKIFIKYSC
jgi:hypothetical protein